MVSIFQEPLTATQIKQQAKVLGADLVGIADGKAMNENPGGSAHQRPADITDHDGDRVIVLAKRYSAGTARIAAWNNRHKFYNDELALTALEETSLELVYWLEEKGYPAIIVPPTHVDPWRYWGDPNAHQETLLSFPHAAVEAGLGTLGLNLQLITPEFGPRVILTAVMCSVDCETDRPMTTALCKGPECGRCLQACPGDVIGNWQRNWSACDDFRAPHGFKQLTTHMTDILNTDDPDQRKNLVRSETSFNLWQSILRGSGVITGCRRCQDVCPVGEDYAGLSDALDEIAEATAEKQQRLDDYKKQAKPETYKNQARWIGELKS